MTDELQAKIAEGRIAKGRALLKCYDEACERSLTAQGFLANVNRAIESSQQPRVHAQLVGTDQPQSVRSKYVAQNEVNAAHAALIAWFEEPDHDLRDFGALRALFAGLGEG